MLKWAHAPEGTDASVARRNFIANVMDGAFFSLALSFVSQQTVLPVYVKEIGGGNIAVGLIPVLWTFGFNFPQILIAGYAQRAPRKRDVLLKTAMAQRIPWLLLAVVPFILTGRVSTSFVLIAFFLLFFLAAAGGSINLPVWFDLVAKLTPVTARGRLFAMRNIIGSAFGIAGGAVAAFVLGSVQPPLSFAILFLLAFIAMMASYVFLTRLEEAPATPKIIPVHDWKIVSMLPQILRARVNYRNFLIGDALLMTSTMANAFFTLHALEKFSLSDAYAGTFTVIIMISMIVGSFCFGLLADRFGHRLNMLLSAVSTFLACLVALIAPGIEMYGLAFVLSAFTVTLGGISRLPLIAELCSSAERPTFVALSNMLTSPFVLAGIAGGWIADALGFHGVFAVAGVIALIAFTWWLTMVDEPRQTLIQQQRSAT